MKYLLIILVFYLLQISWWWFGNLSSTFSKFLCLSCFISSFSFDWYWSFYRFSVNKFRWKFHRYFLFLFILVEIQNDVLYRQLSYWLLCSFFRCCLLSLMLVIVRIFNPKKNSFEIVFPVLASGVFLCVTILNIVVIGGMTILYW